MPIDRLEDVTGQKLLPPEVEEEINTLGGLVTTLAGRVTARGEATGDLRVSRSRCWTPIRDGSNACACAGCRRRRRSPRSSMPERASTLAFRGAIPVAPVQLAALRLAELQGLRRYGAAFLLGVLAAAALPPVDMTPVLILSFVGFVWLFDGAQRSREALGIGWCFGLCFFVAGLYWLTTALFVDIARFWWLTPFALLGVPAGLAIFTGAAVLGAHLICRWLKWRGASRALALAVARCGAEAAARPCAHGFPGT